MLEFLKSRTFTTGLAMFSMFFGAGNVVFPLAVGQFAQDGNIFAALGLLLTAVGVPFLGLVSMTLFSGDYEKFFERVGKNLGFILSLSIIVLIGPLGAMPRTIALSYSTTQMFWPDLSLPYFSFAACILIFILTIRKNKIVDIIGTYLTPFLLISLGIIIVRGLMIGPHVASIDLAPLPLFLHGLNEGYQTMDLLGAFFFSTVIIASLKKQTTDASPKSLMKLTLKASLIGGSLLSAVYLGMSFVAASWSEQLALTRPDYYLGTLAVAILGPYAGVIACIAVALACLTTAIALAAVSSEFIHRVIFKKKISYAMALMLTIGINYFISTLEFTGIMEFLAPIMQVCYPALILLSILNILYKLFDFQIVKFPTVAIFVISLWGALAF
jgi:LIVCS family branched-chain amino acid:cation transporter